MANIKISQLPVGTSPLDGTEIVPIVQNGTTVKIAASEIGATATPGYTAEDEANKTQDIFADGTSTVKYPSAKATKDYADSLVVGLLDDRGNFTPSITSPGTYPVANGSGPAGAIEKGDIWFISAPGYIGTTAVTAGMSVRALADAPGQTASNWDLIDYSLGYTPENINNKVTSAAQIVTFANSTVKYPAVKAIKDYVDSKPHTLQGILDADHSLANGINLQGTNAGDTMSAAGDVNAFGTSAAQGNMGNLTNFFGPYSGYNNQSDNVNAMGSESARGNIGQSVNAFGTQAAYNNHGSNIAAIGDGAANGNLGNAVIGIGLNAASTNSGNNVIALGANAGIGNTHSNVVLLGNGASASANNQIVHRNPTMGYNGTIDFNNLTDNHTLNFPNADGTPVMKVNGIAADAQGEVTIPASAATLQAVTTAGNTTTDDIQVNSLYVANQYQPSSASPYNVSVQNNQFKITRPNGSSLFTADPGYIFWGAGGSNGNIMYSAGGFRTYYMPNTDGRFVLSVNGQPADAAGNVTLGEPYLVYSALLNFDGSTVVPYILKNTLGTTINWTCPSNGLIRGAAAAGTPFTLNKTSISNGSYGGGGGPFIVTSRPRNPFQTSQIDYFFYLHDGTLTFTPLIDNFPVEIRVYP